jgi:hypothetical protein
VSTPPATPPAPTPVDCLLELIRRARSAESEAALRFIAVNDSHLLAPYQLAALWLRGSGARAFSGVIEVDANVPYAQWVDRVGKALADTPSRAITSADLPETVASEWSQWLPPHALWIRFGQGDTAGGLLVARELPWRDIDVHLFVEWMETWCCAFRAWNRPGLIQRLFSRQVSKKPLRHGRTLVIGAALTAAACFPVRLSVLAPGELVPANPAAVRAPLDGVIKTFYVQTNQPVKAGDPLFAYDDVVLASKLGVATEALRTAETEQRQLSQMALVDAKARASLPGAQGQVEEKRLEVEYLRSQLERNRVLAPRDGVVFIDDPSEWIGRSVMAGQRILRLAEPDDKEVEAWLPVGDAIVLPPEAPARLYLSASPLSPVAAATRYVGYEAQRRPDGEYAYRVRAKLASPTEHRVGLKGTVRLSGQRLPLAYWVMRRPIAAARAYLAL